VPLEDPSALETFSKRAAIASLAAIPILQLTLHPDMTWALRAAGLSALVAGWILARAGSPAPLTMWLTLAPLFPALLLVASGRQGTGIDAVWMAGLAGFLVRVAPWSRWSLPSLWSIPLGGWALVLSLGWPVVVLREAGFDLHALQDNSAINSWSMLPAPQVVAWTLHVVGTQLLGLLWLEWVHRALIADPTRLPRPVDGLWVGVTLASMVALVQGTFDITFLNPEFWSDIRRATGTMLDANAYGTAAAIAGPVAFLALRGSRPSATTAGALALAVNWAGVWMSGSRTAFLCALLGAAGLVIGLWRAQSDRRLIRPAILVGAAGGAAAAVVIFFAGVVGPLQRSDGVPVTPDLRGVASLWTRGGYGTVAVQMTREYPLTGVGSGAYRYLAPDYWRAIADEALQVDNAQNWWRHQIAEQGVLGSLLVLAWSVLVAWLVIAGRARPDLQREGWTARGLLAGLGAASLLGMPTQNPVVLLWFFVLAAWLAHVTTMSPRLVVSAGPWVRRGWVVASVLAVAYAGAELVLARGPLAVDERARRFKRPYVDGAYAVETADADVFRWTDEESRFMLPVRSPRLVMRLWAHHPDIAARPLAVAIESPCGVVFRGELQSHDPVSVTIAVPADLDVVDAVIRVSRTWTPADHGSADSRQLGVAVSADFVDGPDTGPSNRADWGNCRLRR
jgi:O-antigen ligase